MNTYILNIKMTSQSLPNFCIELRAAVFMHGCFKTFRVPITTLIFSFLVFIVLQLRGGGGGGGKGKAQEAPPT